MKEKFNMSAMDDANELMYYLNCLDLFDVIVKSFKKLRNTKEGSLGTLKRLPQKQLDKFKEFLVELPDTFLVANDDGQNLGMIACKYGVEEIALLALDNEEASIQQDNNGMNIGMWAAECGLVRATQKALENPIARKQRAKFWDNLEEKHVTLTIKKLAKKNGIKLDKIDDDSSDLIC